MKVWYYVFIATGLIVLLHFAGLPSAGTPLLNLMGLSFNADGSAAQVTTTAGGFYDVLFEDKEGVKGILVAIAAAVGGLAVGLFTSAKPENLILLPLITTTLVLFLATFVGIMNYAIGTGNIFVSSIVVLIFLPLTIGFILALAEFFRGSD